LIGSDRKTIDADGKTARITRQTIHITRKRNCAVTDMDQAKSIWIVMTICIAKGIEK